MLVVKLKFGGEVLKKGKINAREMLFSLLNEMYNFMNIILVNGLFIEQTDARKFRKIG